jgi:hypothetical protein
LVEDDHAAGIASLRQVGTEGHAAQADRQRAAYLRRVDRTGGEAERGLGEQDALRGGRLAGPRPCHRLVAARDHLPKPKLVHLALGNAGNDRIVTALTSVAADIEAALANPNAGVVSVS